jgi:hypothetical protein
MLNYKNYLLLLFDILLKRVRENIIQHFKKKNLDLISIEKLAARATSTTIVRDILAVIFLMDKSQGQSRIRIIKIKEGLLKVLLNLVKSSMLIYIINFLLFIIYIYIYMFRNWSSSIFGSKWFLFII